MCTSSNINPLSTVAVAQTGFRQHIPALKPKDIRFISALAFVTLKTTGTEAAMIRERSDVWGCFLFPVNIYLRWWLESQVLSLFTWTDFTGLPDTFLSAVKSGEVSVHADIHLQTPGQKHRAVLNNGTKSTTTLLICYVYGKHLSIQSSKGSFLGITNACKMMEKKKKTSCLIHCSSIRCYGRHGQTGLYPAKQGGAGYVHLGFLIRHVELLCYIIIRLLSYCLFSAMPVFPH